MIIVHYYIGKSRRVVKTENRYFKSDPAKDYVEVGLLDEKGQAKVLTIPKKDVGLILTDKMTKRDVKPDKITRNPVTGY